MVLLLLFETHLEKDVQTQLRLAPDHVCGGGSWIGPAALETLGG